MNNHTTTTKPVDLIQLLVDSIQYNRYTQAIHQILILSMGSFGTVFNLVSFLIFCKKSFNSVPLFRYLRVYTFASFTGSLTLMSTFFLVTHSYQEVLLAYVTRLYACKILPSFVNALLFFFENSLDIFINLERALCFSTRFQAIKKISPYLISFLLLILCALINGPVYFLYDIVEDSQLPIELKLCKLTEFTKSYLGRLLLVISFIIQGPVVLILVIATNIIALICFRRYIKKKRLLNAHNTIENETEIQKKKRKQDEKETKKLFLLTFYLSIFSVLNHLMAFSAQFVVFIAVLSPTVNAWFILIYTFAFAFKNLINIFFFSKYNRRFRNSLLVCFKTWLDNN